MTTHRPAPEDRAYANGCPSPGFEPVQSDRAVLARLPVDDEDDIRDTHPGASADGPEDHP